MTYSNKFVPPVSASRTALRSLDFALAALAALVFVATPHNVHAASDTWTGSSGAVWTNSANWLGGGVPGGASDIATFSGISANTTIDLGSGVTNGLILFDTSSAPAYTIGSGGVGAQTLTFNSATGLQSIVLSSTVTNSQTINANILANTADNTFRLINSNSASSGVALIVNGTISGGTGTTQRTINVLGNVTLNGAVSAGSASSAPNLAQTGAGTLTLGGSATSTLASLRTSTGGGLVLINGQTVTVSSGSSYGGSGTGATGKFDLVSGSASFNGGISIGASSTDGSMIRVSGGTFNASSVTIGGRTWGNSSATATTAAPTTTGLVFLNGTSTITGNVGVLGSSANVSGLVSGGTVSIGGELQISQGANAGRWSVFQVSGGTLTVSDAVNGITVGMGASGNTTKGSLYLTGGTTTAEKVTFGISNAMAGSSGTMTMGGTSAVLYLGSGGIVKAATNAYTELVTLSSGTLGAKADWSSALGMSLTGTAATNMIIKAADASDVAKNITLSGSLTNNGGFTKTGGGTLTLSGANTYSGGTVISNGTVLLSGSGTLGSTTGAVTVTGGTFDIGGLTRTNGAISISSGTITNGTLEGTSFASTNGGTIGAVLTGSGALAKSGTGTLTLSGANNYTGATTVSAGALNVQNAAGLGDAASGVTVSSGAALELQGSITIASESLGLSGTGISTGGALRNISGNNTYGGTITNTAAARINSDSGTLTLSGGINATNQAITFGGAGNIVISGAITNSTAGLTKDGAGTLALSGANTYTGTTTISTGVMRLDTATTLQSSTVAINADNGLAFGTGITAATIGGLSGANALALTNADASAVTLTVGNNNANTSYSGALSGGGSLTKIGTGTLTLSTAATYTGGTTIKNGMVTMNTTGVLGTNTVTLEGGSLKSGADGVAIDMPVYVGASQTGNVITPNRMTWSGAVSGSGTLNVAVTTTVTRFDLQNTWTNFSGNLNFTGSGGIRLIDNGGTFDPNSFRNLALNLAGSVSLNPVTYSGGGTILIGSLASTNTSSALGGGSAGRATYSVGGLNTSTTFAGSIAGNSALTKTGTGTLTLSGTNNTYTGATTISAGTLALSGSGSLASTTTMAVSSGATFDVGGRSQEIAGLSGAGSVTNASGILTVNNTNSSTFSGALSGAGSLTKAGSGTLILSGNNAYSGGTLVSAGKLRLDRTTAAGTGTITQTDGTSTLEINTTGTVANAMDIYNISTLQSVTLSGNKTLNNATYTVASSTTTTDSGNLSGTGGVTKEGAGTLILTGDNSYTGAVAVNAGLLNLNSSTGGAAATTSTVSVASGATLLVSQSNQVSDIAEVTLSGGTIRRGSGASEVFGALTLTADSYLDFGGVEQSNKIQFGALSLGSYKVNVSNFNVLNQLAFTAASLENGQSILASSFTFAGSSDYTSSFADSTFTITGISAIPEPSTYLAATGLLGLMLWPTRRRIVRDVKRFLGFRRPAHERMQHYRHV